MQTARAGRHRGEDSVAKVASLGLVRLRQQPLPHRSDRAATLYPQLHKRQVEKEPPWREDAQVDWANRCDRRYLGRMMFQFLVALRARRRLARLRSELSGPFAGKRALVVGSAPGLVVPAKDRFDLALCVNGSGFPARALGIDRPALTVVSGFSTRSDSHLRKETHRAWRGLETDCLVLVASGRRARRERRVIEAAGLRFERFVLLSAEDRALIVVDVCKDELARGERDQRISMGTFAAILALWSGASEAILCGFSLSGGHSYVDEDTPRHHVAGDIRFLECAHELGLPLSTTARPIHETFGLALIS